MNINLNNVVIKLVVSVITIGIGILLLTIFPLGVFAFLALLGVLYYFFKNSKKAKK
jgi:hypothetical protein